MDDERQTDRPNGDGRVMDRYRFSPAMLLAVAMLCTPPTLRGQADLEFPLVREGACPGECCVYGAWMALDEIAVFAERRAERDTLFNLAEGELFVAVTGEVHVLEPAVVVVRGPYAALAMRPGETGLDSLRFAPGDTVYALDYLGEGFFNLWVDGSTWEVEAFWGTPDDPPGVDRLAWAETDPVTEWWVKVRTNDGREGWVEMKRGVPIRGYDACG